MKNVPKSKINPTAAERRRYSGWWYGPWRKTRGWVPDPTNEHMILIELKCGHYERRYPSRCKNCGAPYIPKRIRCSLCDEKAPKDWGEEN